MHIAVKIKGQAFISLAGSGNCLSIGSVRCEGSLDLCKTEVCSSGGGYKLEEFLGPHIWKSLGKCKEGDTKVLILEDGHIYEAVEFIGCYSGPCDWNCTPMCERYCAGRNKGALCHILGLFFSHKNQIMFKEVK